MEILPDDRACICRAAKRLGEFLRNHQPAASDAEQPRIGLVIVLVSFDLKKRESRLGIAHSEIERRIGGKFFDDKLLKRCGERRREAGELVGLRRRARSSLARGRAIGR